MELLLFDSDGVLLHGAEGDGFLLVDQPDPGHHCGSRGHALGREDDRLEPGRLEGEHHLLSLGLDLLLEQGHPHQLESVLPVPNIAHSLIPLPLIGINLIGLQLTNLQPEIPLQGLDMAPDDPGAACCDGQSLA